MSRLQLSTEQSLVTLQKGTGSGLRNLGLLIFSFASLSPFTGSALYIVLTAIAHNVLMYMMVYNPRQWVKAFHMTLYFGHTFCMEFLFPY